MAQLYSQQPDSQQPALVTISITDQHGVRTYQGTALNISVDMQNITSKVYSDGGFSDEMFRSTRMKFNVDMIGTQVFGQKVEAKPKAKKLSRKILYD